MKGKVNGTCEQPDNASPSGSSEITSGIDIESPPPTEMNTYPDRAINMAYKLDSELPNQFLTGITVSLFHSTYRQS
jgi:hypothetical protein